MSVVVSVWGMWECLLCTDRCTHGGEVMYFWSVFRGELVFLKCHDICICVVNKQFELLEFVVDSDYVDMQYDEISLTFTAGFVWYL